MCIFDKKSVFLVLSIFFIIALAPVLSQHSIFVGHSSVITKSVDFPTVDAAKVKHKYVGSVNSNIYHKLKCRYVKRIKKYNKIYFKTMKQAKRTGYRACKVCF